MWRGPVAHLVDSHTLTAQGMVLGKTYRLKSSGYYLRPKEREEMEGGEKGGEGEEVEVTWEKMSKSKYNGVDPEVSVSQGGREGGGGGRGE